MQVTFLTVTRGENTLRQTQQLQQRMSSDKMWPKGLLQQGKQWPVLWGRLIGSAFLVFLYKENMESSTAA